MSAVVTEDPFVDDDIIIRQTFSPTDFIDGTGPLSLSQSMAFPSDGGYSESVDCKRFIIDYPIEIHARGNVRATEKTVQRVAAGKPELEYIGFIEAALVAVLSLEVGGHRFSISHEPEEGNQAHCNLRFIFPDNKPKKSVKSSLLKDFYELFSDVISV